MHWGKARRPGISHVLLQGNGTSAIFAEDDRVTTFDVHGTHFLVHAKTFSAVMYSLPSSRLDM